MQSALAACTTEVAASRCTLPMPFPPLASSPQRIEQHALEHLRGCSADVADASALFCDEYPCLFAVRADADFDHGDCGLMGDDPPETNEHGWIVGPIEAPDDVPDMSAAWQARRRHRTDRIMAQLARDPPASWSLGLLGVREHAAPCSDAPALADNLRGEAACEHLLTWLGCERRPEDEPWVRDHMREAKRLIADLEDTCEPFAEVPHALDCSQVPCLLAFEPEAGVPWGETLCNERGVTSEFTGGPRVEGDARWPAAIVDVHGFRQEPEWLDHWEATRMVRTFFWQVP